MKISQVFLLLSIISFLIISNSFTQTMARHQLFENNIIPGPAIENPMNNHLFKNEYLQNRIAQFSKPVTAESLLVVDSVKIVKTDGTLENHIYQYTSYGLFSLSQTKIWNGSQWLNSEQDVYTYSDTNMVTLHQKWVNGGWVNVWRETYIYSTGSLYNYNTTIYQTYKNGSWVNERLSISEGNSDYSIYTENKWIDGRWQKTERSTYQYNSQHRPTEYLTEKWKNNEWVKDYRTRNEYTPNGLYITYTINENWDDTNNTWIPLGRNTCSEPDANGIPTLIICDTYENGSWSPSARCHLTYDAAGRLTYVFNEQWNAEVYEKYQQQTYNYDLYGNILSFYQQFYNSEEGDWRNSYGYRYNYVNGLMQSGYSLKGNGSGWEPFDGPLFVYINRDSWPISLYFVGCEIYPFYGKILTGIKNSEIIEYDFSLEQNYPNPFNPSTTISYTLPKSGLVQLKVYDLLGREVAALVNRKQNRGSYKVVFNADNLPNGVYIYKLQSGNLIKTKKMILLK